MAILLAMFLLSASVLGAGAAVQLLPGDVTRWLKPMLAFSGAYLFSITILHLLPETLQLAGANSTHIGYWVLTGFFLQLLLELASEGIEHGHVHRHPERKGGYGPVLLLASLVVHSALEGSILTERATQAGGGFWPVLLGVVLHHIPAALALMSVLLARLSSFRRAMLYLAAFALASPLGMLIGGWLESGPSYPILAGLVAGNFLHISTTILFETTPNHRFDRHKMFATVCGVALALLIT
jgi:zinc and cadmium transporter